MKPFQHYTPEFDLLTAEENFYLEKCLISVEKFIRNSKKISGTDYATRDAHSKTYAFLQGTLEMEKEIPPMVKAVFSKKKYSATCRLSHANPVLSRSKNEMPAFGFALKLRNSTGRDCNFPLANFPLFPMKDISGFLKFFTSLNTFMITKEDNFVVSVMDLPHLLKNSAGFALPFFSLDFMKNFAKITAAKNDFILSFDFHSIGAYRLGDFIMKLKLVPQYRHKKFGDGNDQRTRTESYLNSTDATFDLMMQFCSDLKKQPVNDLTKIWKDAPHIKVGTLTIPQHSLLDVDAPENESIGFNPFENPDELLPVGKIQQLRRKIYETSIATRNSINQSS